MAIVFEGVSVVPMDSERVLDGHTVIIEDDRIAWIGPAAEAKVPVDAQRVDGRGKYLMPGLCDMHSHPADEDDLVLLIGHGVTTIRNLFGMPRHVLWRERTAARQLLGPTIYTSGPVVDGRPVRSNGSLSVVTKEEAIAAVELTKQGGYDCVKVYDQLSRDAYGWIVEAARERRLPIDGHIPFAVGLHDVLDARQRSIEHLYGYPGALQPASSSNATPHDLGQLRTWLFDMAENAERDRINELAEKTREAGTWNCATLIVRTRWCEDGDALATLPEMRFLSPVQISDAREFFAHYPKEPGRFAVRDFNSAVLRGLNEAGAGLLIGTDALVPGIVYGASVHEELRAFVNAGLSPFETLRAGTSGPAKFFGESGQWGQVIVGARADLLLVDGNPLADVGNASRQAGVMVRGRWLPHSEIADLLADIASRRQEPTPQRAHLAPSAPASDSGDVQRFAVTWNGHTLGEEEIAVKANGSGNRTLTATSAIDSFEWEFGTFRAEVTVDADGADLSAWFELDAEDGHDRVEMSRENGIVRVRRSQAVAGDTEATFPDPDGTALFGPTLAPLYARLVARLAGLAVGEELQVPTISLSRPPDTTITEGTLHAVRVPDDSDDSTSTGPKYVVDFSRTNWKTSAVVTCDSDHRLIDISVGTDMAYWLNNTGTTELDESSLVRTARVSSGSP
jgi:Amidohydrolase family